MQVRENLHNPFACLAVQIPGRLVGKQKGGLDGQSTGNSYALYFPTRKLRGPMPDFLPEADLAQELQAPFTSDSSPHALIDQGQLDVFEHIVLRDEIEGLKDKANPLITEPGECRVAQRFDRHAVQPIPALHSDGRDTPGDGGGSTCRSRKRP